MSADEASSLPVEEMHSLAIEASSPPTPSTKSPAAEPLATAANIKAEPNDTASTVAAPAEIVKIDILLNATGNVPIMKKRKWCIAENKPISWIISFIHKYLKLDPEDKIFLYVNQTFAPSPDQTIRNLYDCYESNGRLVLYYCKSQAWG